jgi:hypothetical protein
VTWTPAAFSPPYSGPRASKGHFDTRFTAGSSREGLNPSETRLSAHRPVSSLILSTVFKSRQILPGLRIPIVHLIPSYPPLLSQLLLYFSLERQRQYILLANLSCVLIIQLRPICAQRWSDQDHHHLHAHPGARTTATAIGVQRRITTRPTASHRLRRALPTSPPWYPKHWTTGSPAVHRRRLVSSSRHQHLPALHHIQTTTAEGTVLGKHSQKTSGR